VSAPVVPDRTELIRKILKSTAQLHSDREGGARRAASGVVLATDSVRRRAWILTTRHFLDPPISQEIWVRLPGSLDGRNVVIELNRVAKGADGQLTTNFDAATGDRMNEVQGQD
jgi:hypothetical protein